MSRDIVVYKYEYLPFLMSFEMSKMDPFIREFNLV